MLKLSTTFGINMSKIKYNIKDKCAKIKYNIMDKWA